MSSFSKLNGIVYGNSTCEQKHDLLSVFDFYYSTFTYRKSSEADILMKFRKSYLQDSELTMNLLFYMRTINGGLGEKRVFRIAMNEVLSKNYYGLSRDAKKKLVTLIPRVGCWSDIFSDEMKGSINYTIPVVKSKLKWDLNQLKYGGDISLLAKWIPCSRGNDRAKEQTGRWSSYLGYTSGKKYRQDIMSLRKNLAIVERSLCNHNFKVKLRSLNLVSFEYHSKVLSKYQPEEYTKVAIERASRPSKKNHIDHKSVFKDSKERFSSEYTKALSSENYEESTKEVRKKFLKELKELAKSYKFHKEITKIIRGEL